MSKEPPLLYAEMKSCSSAVLCKVRAKSAGFVLALEHTQCYNTGSKENNMPQASKKEYG